MITRILFSLFFFSCLIVISQKQSYIDQDDYLKYENKQEEQILQWLELQKEKSKTYLSAINQRDTLIRKLYNFSNKLGGKASYLRNDARNNYYFVKNDTLFQLKSGSRKEIFTINSYNNLQDKNYIISYLKPSYSGNTVLVCLSLKGSETSKVILINTEDKTISETNINSAEPALGGLFWAPDDSGFFYTSTDLSLVGTKLNNTNTTNRFYHIKNRKDFEFFSRFNKQGIAIKPEEFPIVYINYPSDQFLVATIYDTSPGFISYSTPVSALSQPIDSIVWKPLFTREEKVKEYYQINDSIIYLTSKNAPNFKICQTSITQPDFKNPSYVVKETSDEIIRGFTITSKGIFYATLKNGTVGNLYWIDKNNHTRKIALPFSTGYIEVSALSKDQPDISITLQGWLNPKRKFTFDYQAERLIEDQALKTIYPKIEDDQLNNLIVEEVEVPSRDGVLIPLSLIYSKDMVKDGSNSVLIRAYGAYGVPMSPIFSHSLLLPAFEGGIYAIAHVRGGGEKGDRWYKAGYKATKKNTWQDLIDCTQFLIDQNYTAKKKVAMWSGSAGGITIGNALVKRPELYGAAIIDNGVLNPLRFNHALNGIDSMPEFGSPNDLEELPYLEQMDAFTNIKEKLDYPATLLRLGMKDQRVDPFQTMKFGAKLKDYHMGSKPILIYPDFESGHLLRLDSKEKQFRKTAEAIAFALLHTGHPKYQLEVQK
ncbi:prolyl oligopeptidase family serine peptidase [Aquimarina sp. ERC-38]|uniref:prolyl oligopeptidase family serine peptidase n=1 Tax=Aquimarina sp. ERC-38 TaxID=2949996 RepID=UPI002248449D|nr:prolyl oligopeptidase family serine peptidase [Aquimarina sp. ERC-38]UZO82181.1 prolyl oligopeptidase family serine peptidase [Aquimarina sp. ERC-38]